MTVVPNWARNVLVFAVCADAEVSMSFWTPRSAVTIEPVVARVNAVTADIADHIRAYLRCPFWADTYALFQFCVPENAAVWQLALSARCSAPDRSCEVQLLAESANIIGIVRFLALLSTALSSPVRQRGWAALTYPIKSVYR